MPSAAVVGTPGLSTPTPAHQPAGSPRWTQQANLPVGAPAHQGSWFPLGARSPLPPGPSWWALPSPPPTFIFHSWIFFALILIISKAALRVVCCDAELPGALKLPWPPLLVRVSEATTAPLCRPVPKTYGSQGLFILLTITEDPRELCSHGSYLSALSTLGNEAEKCKKCY